MKTGFYFCLSTWHIQINSYLSCLHPWINTVCGICKSVSGYYKKLMGKLEIIPKQQNTDTYTHTKSHFQWFKKKHTHTKLAVPPLPAFLIPLTQNFGSLSLSFFFQIDHILSYSGEEGGSRTEAGHWMQECLPSKEFFNFSVGPHWQMDLKIC